MPETFQLGWYHVDEVYQLYIDQYDEVLEETKRVLTPVHVDYVCVDDHPDDRDAPEDSYHVDHYDREGDLITSLTVEMGDLEDVLGDKEPTDRPMHI